MPWCSGRSRQVRYRWGSGVILRRVRTPESTVCPTREMALKYIWSPVISAAMNTAVRFGQRQMVIHLVDGARLLSPGL